MYVDGLQNSYAGNAGNVTTSGQYNTALALALCALNSSGQYIRRWEMRRSSRTRTEVKIRPSAPTHFSLSAPDLTTLGSVTAPVTTLRQAPTTSILATLRRATESGIIRIGTQGTQTACYLAAQSMPTAHLSAAATGTPRKTSRPWIRARCLKKSPRCGDPLELQRGCGHRTPRPHGAGFLCRIQRWTRRPHIATIDESAWRWRHPGVEPKLNEKDAEIQSLKRQE